MIIKIQNGLNHIIKAEAKVDSRKNPKEVENLVSMYL